MGILVGAAEQNTEIPIPGGPGAVFPLYGKALGKHLLHPPGNIAGLGDFRGHRLPGEEDHLGFTARLFLVPGPIGQALLPGVVNVSRLPAHQPGKHKVHPVCHLPAGAKIPVQHNIGRVLVQVPAILLVAASAAKKDFRHGPAKAVNALLYVPNHKQVFPLLGDGPKNGILHLVNVLVLVDHNLVEPAGHLLGGGGGASILPAKQADGAVLQIAVIQKILFPLFLLVPPGKIHGQPGQALQQGAGGLQLLGAALPAGGKAFAQALHHSLYLFAAGLQPEQQGVLLVPAL